MQHTAFAGRGFAAAAGKDFEARRLLLHEHSAGTQHASPVLKALVNLGLKEIDAGLERLWTAFEQRDQWLLLIDVRPDFEEIQNDPAFRDVVDSVKREPRTGNCIVSPARSGGGTGAQYDRGDMDPQVRDRGGSRFPARGITDGNE